MNMEEIDVIEFHNLKSAKAELNINGWPIEENCTAQQQKYTFV